MNVFISWSGNTSMQIANILKRWIPRVIQSAKPYYTPSDIEKGTKWESEINKKLNDSLIGLICITKDNTEKPWILFEAGALSNKLEKSKVCPILFGIKKSELKGPLATFQLTEFNKEDFYKLINSINNSLDTNKIEKTILYDVFEAFYPELESNIKKILNEDKSSKPLTSPRSDRDILEEILDLTRKQYNYPKNKGVLGNKFPEVNDQYLFHDYGIKEGDNIKHLKFGEGKVLSITGNNSERKATIEFNEHGTKKLLLMFSKLEKI